MFRWCWILLVYSVSSFTCFNPQPQSYKYTHSSSYLNKLGNTKWQSSEVRGNVVWTPHYSNVSSITTNDILLKSPLQMIWPRQVSSDLLRTPNWLKGNVSSKTTNDILLKSPLQMIWPRQVSSDILKTPDWLKGPAKVLWRADRVSTLVASSVKTPDWSKGARSSGMSSWTPNSKPISKITSESNSLELETPLYLVRSGISINSVELKTPPRFVESLKISQNSAASSKPFELETPLQLLWSKGCEIRSLQLKSNVNLIRTQRSKETGKDTGLIYEPFELKMPRRMERLPSRVATSKRAPIWSKGVDIPFWMKNDKFESRESTTLLHSKMALADMHILLKSLSTFPKFEEAVPEIERVDMRNSVLLTNPLCIEEIGSAPMTVLEQPVMLVFPLTETMKLNRQTALGNDLHMLHNAKQLEFHFSEVEKHDREEWLDERKRRFGREGMQEGGGEGANKKFSNGDQKPWALRSRSFTNRRSGRGNRGRFSDFSRPGRKKKRKSRFTAAEIVAARDAAMKRVTLSEEAIRISDLSSMIKQSPTDVVKYLMKEQGMMAAVDQHVASSTAKVVARAFGYLVLEEGQEWEGLDKYLEENREATGETEEASDETDDDSKGHQRVLKPKSPRLGQSAMFIDKEEDLETRPPVVTIMGHVDHGKTTLLDAIRGSSVVTGEAGGITQHVGCYQIKTKSGNLISFVDTPGHAAFTGMRKRGADVTDIIVLVIAADEGIKAQTVDALLAAKEASKSVIIAFNKMDKDGVDVARVAGELTAYGIVIEDLGGEVLSSEISAKEKSGLDGLLENILLQAELLDLRANPNTLASGVVIESRMLQGHGSLATTLITRGTLNLGDEFIVGDAFGKVKTILNDKGERMPSALPSDIVQISGMDKIPTAGSLFQVGENRNALKSLAEARIVLAKQDAASKFDKSITQAAKALQVESDDSKDQKEIILLVKSDVAGSLDAIENALQHLTKEDGAGVVKVQLIGAGVGEINMADIAMAAVRKAWVIAFNVAVSAEAAEHARARGIKLSYYNIIYELLDALELKMNKLLSPTPDGELRGKASVKQIFDIGKIGKICGCGVVEGSMIKVGSQVRVMRGDRIMHTGPVKTLKSFKEDVNQVKEGFDCGINLHGWEEMEVGDILECYVSSGDTAPSSENKESSATSSQSVKTKKRKKRRKTSA